MSDTTQHPEYVDSRTAAQILGVKQAKVFYHAERGEIELEPGRPRKDSRYKVSDLLKVKARLQEKRRRPEPVTIDFVRLEDLPAAFKLAQQVYGPEGVDLATMSTYQSWRKNNGRITLGAFSKDRSNCYASIQLVPLDEAIILEILSGKRTESSIQPDEIRSYEAPGPYTLLATSAVYTKEKQHRNLLIELLIHYMNFWAEQYPEKWITRVYAQAETERGEMLVQHFFMSPLLYLAENAYMLDVNRPSASKIVRAFQARLKERGPWPPANTPKAIPTPATVPLYRYVTDNPVVSTPEPAQPAPLPQREARRTPETHESETKESIPDGWVGAVSFAKRHGIQRDATVTEAIRNGRIKAHENAWLEGRASVKYAFDPAQQKAFCERLAEKGTLKPCGDDDCACARF